MKNNKNNSERVNAIYFAMENNDIYNSIDGFNDLIKNSKPENIGANYYLANYLHGFLPKEGNVMDYTKEELSLQKRFIESIIPHLSNQMMPNKIRKIHEKYVSDPCYLGFHEYYKFMAQASASNIEIKKIVDALAEISMIKIVNKQPISERDYGYIINKIALYIGNQFSQEYHMLYIGLFHEITQSHNYGDTAEKYLNDMLRKKCIIDDSLIGKGFIEDSPSLKMIKLKRDSYTY